MLLAGKVQLDENSVAYLITILCALIVHGSNQTSQRRACTFLPYASHASLGTCQ